MLGETFSLGSSLDALTAKFSSSLVVVDTHTCGATARLLLGGFPPVKGETIHERMEYFREELDHIRVALMQEPRGHESSYGAVLLPPSTSEEDMSCLFMHNSGYSSMCGHVSIAIGNLIKQVSSSQRSEKTLSSFRLRTLAGIIHLDWSNAEAISGLIAYQNVPSFLYCEAKISVTEVGDIPVAISFGGNFYVLVNIENLPRISNQISILELTAIGARILDEVNRHIEIVHPLDKSLKSASLVMFYGLPGCTRGNTRSFTTWEYNKFDRSPCGTGTSALLAYLYSRHQLKIGAEYVVESVIGTIFRAQLLKETWVGSYRGIIPKIVGESYITGLNRVVIDPCDPLKEGFKTPVVPLCKG